MLIVQKYGGTSLADTERLRAAARRIAGLAAQGHGVVAVVSAQGDTTDLLLKKALRLNPHAATREMDAYLASGEQMSAGLLAMALQALDCDAVSLTGWQAGIQTDDAHGDASIREIDTRRLRKELARGKVAVVAGFQGISPEGDITTLGRGGSDTTAVALAAALNAGKCQIFTDVDGVYDRDPRKYPDALRYEKLDYGTMLRLIAGGAQVLHHRCVELARDYEMPIEVLSSFTGAPGTIVCRLESF